MGQSGSRVHRHTHGQPVNTSGPPSPSGTRRTVRRRDKKKKSVEPTSLPPPVQSDASVSSHSSQQPLPSNFGASTSSSTPQSTTDSDADMGVTALGINPPAVSMPLANASTTKRSSFRKSIMNLVRPTSLFDSKAHSTPTDKKKASKKEKESWRTSRRFEKSPAAETVEEAPAPSSETNVIEEAPREVNGQAPLPTAAPPASTSQPCPLTHADKATSKQPASDVPQDAVSVASAVSEEHTARASTPYPDQLDPHLHDTDQQDQATSDEHEGREGEHAVTSWLEEQLERAESSSAADLAADRAAQRDSPILASASGPNAAPALATPSASAGTPTTAAGGRAFPPPGTLVVVQGIVHTSDAPPSSTSRGRTQPRPPTPRFPSNPATSAASTISSTTSTERNDDTNNTTPNLSEDEEVRQPVPPAISSGSIDVLGTLLSVAAAATAASLLTGSTPGSTPASPTATASPASPTSAQSDSRSLDASPTSPPLASLAESTPHVGASSEHMGRAERMRQAWGTIRERLGLRSGVSTSAHDPASSVHLTTSPPINTVDSGTADASPSSSGSTTPTPASSRRTTVVPPTHNPVTDTRELMLAEMARAFNIGLGLNSSSAVPPSSLTGRSVANGDAPPTTTWETGSDTAETTTVETTNTSTRSFSTSGAATVPTNSPSTAASGTAPPAEGSFDRFLHDLQADLRVALRPPAPEEVAQRLREERERREREERMRREAEQAIRDAAARSSQRPVLDTSVSAVSVPSSSTSSNPVGLLPNPHISQDDALRASETQAPMSGVNEDPRTLQLREYQQLHLQREQEQRDQQQPEDDGDDYSDMPALGEASDESHSEESHIGSHYRGLARHEGETAASAGNPVRPVVTPITIPAGSTTGSGTTALGSGRIDVNGRINWWRMYRFPSITASNPQGAATSAASPTGSPSAPSTAEQVPPTTPQPTTTTTTTTQTSGPAPILPNFLPPPPGQTVVPVIVVGLQSVNSAWQQEELANIAAAAGGPAAGSAIRRASIASGGTSSPSPPRSPSLRPQSPTSPISTNTTSTSSSTRRRREWTQEEIEASPFGWPPVDFDESDEEEEEAEVDEVQRMIDEQRRRREERSAYRTSRATTASDPRSSLDSTPPTANAANEASATPGARTFLIYVIGGYYPPEHTIVTGGLDNFESFEALLELAEMLGHAKPPTVTKEDIDRSGLETIKPYQLSQYEDEGRVSYNCIERCLICLDDYDEEDDIRIMSCRHAFHKNCVDKWLQTGKNNCPACRSTGVNSA